MPICLPIHLPTQHSSVLSAFILKVIYTGLNERWFQQHVAICAVLHTNVYHTLQVHLVILLVTLLTPAIVWKSIDYCLTFVI